MIRHPETRGFLRLVASLLLVLAALLPGCGDDGKGGGDGNGAQADEFSELRSEASRRLAAAGSDAALLKDYRDWLKAEIAKGGDAEAALDPLVPVATKKTAEAFEQVVARQTKNDAAVIGKLVSWAEQTAKEDPDGDLARRLEQPLQELYALQLQVDPSRDDLRERLGYTVYETDLEPYLKVAYIDEDDDIEKIEKIREHVGESVEESPSGKRWLPPHWEHGDELAEVLALVEKRKAEYDERMKDPFESAAAKVRDRTCEALTQRLSKSYEWVARTSKPYVIIVEKDKAWHESKVAAEKADQLQQLKKIFFDAYGEVLGLDEIKEPVPVVVFKRHRAYKLYASEGRADTGSVGHYEPGSGRLFVSDETDRDTLFHEGTHQLIAFHSSGSVRANFLAESYWFQEGTAEYFGGTHVELDDNREWKYELGRLQEGRLAYWRANERKAYSLWDLLDLTYADRFKNMNEGNEELNLMVYSQGWLVVYFLINFAVDEEGLVRVDRPGKYRDAWNRYFAGELKGKSGRKFMLECLGMLKNDGEPDMEKFAAFDEEFTSYYKWLNRKTSMKYHVKDRKIVPWDQVENRGRKIGEKIDDMLVTPENG